MPAVHNAKSQAKDFCDGGRSGRGRRARTSRSRFVLAIALAAGLIGTGIVGFRVRIALATALPTVNGPERSVSRASEAAAKRKDTAHASTTRGWRQFKRA